MLLKPLGYHLFAHTSRDLKVDWRDAEAETEGVREPQQDREQQDTLADTLHDVLVRGLELADKVVVSLSDSELSVRLQHTPYIGMCHSIEEETPQDCEQIGCTLCSMIACVYTEYVDKEVVIEVAKCDGDAITFMCKTLSAASPVSPATARAEPKPANATPWPWQIALAKHIFCAAAKRARRLSSISYLGVLHCPEVEVPLRQWDQSRYAKIIHGRQHFPRRGVRLCLAAPAHRHR